MSDCREEKPLPLLFNFVEEDLGGQCKGVRCCILGNNLLDLPRLHKFVFTYVVGV